MLKHLAAVALGLPILSIAASPTLIDGPVKLDTGLVAGKTVGVAKDVKAFVGIPYAAPPVGDLRWRPPESAAGWSGVRSATEFSAACEQ